MSRRGFTLLETVLAMVVGILVLTATLGVMSAVRASDSMLAVRATQQRELADVRIAVSSALARLRPAPNNIVRDHLGDGVTDDQLDAILDVPYPEPISGLPHHFELSMVDNKPRLEVVVDRLPQGTYRPDEVEDAGVEDEQPENGATFTFDQLHGFRGAFELHASQERTAYELWWVPLPPPDLPEGVVFDESTLPEPRLLCEHVASLSWSAFIDGRKVPLLRAVEARQFPAYVELEISTTDELYASWMFELGWIPGIEYEIDQEPEGEAGIGVPTIGGIPLLGGGGS